MNATISFKLFPFFYFKFLFQKYFLCLCILCCFLASNLFAYDDIDHEAEAENRAYPFIVKKERELKSKNISSEEKEYILFNYYKDYKQKRKVNNTGYSYKWNHIFDNDLIRSNPSTARHFLKKIDNENSQWTLVMKQIPVGHSYKWYNDLDVDETSALSLYSQNLNDFLNGDKPMVYSLII